MSDSGFILLRVSRDVYDRTRQTLDAGMTVKGECERALRELGEEVACSRALEARDVVDEKDYVPRWKYDEQVKQTERAEKERNRARSVCEVVSSDAPDVWFWQGQHDHPETLRCPVVMEAETLRGLLASIEASYAATRVAEEQRNSLLSRKTYSAEVVEAIKRQNRQLDERVRELVAARANKEVP